MAKRLIAAPSGSVMAKRPSMVLGLGLRKARCSSVKANGPSTTARARREISFRPVPSAAVSEMGACCTACFASG